MLKPEHFDWKTLVRLLYQDAEQTTLVVGVCIFVYIFLHYVITFENRANNTRTYKWFLFNAVFIHVLMDGIVGYFHIPKPLQYLYFLLDMRYREEEPTVRLVCLLELTVMAPLCLYIAMSFKKHTKSLRREYAIVVVSVVQFIGTVFFMYHEWAGRNMIDACPWGCLTFTPENLFFFWGIFICANLIWYVVPIKMIVDSYRRVQAMQQKTE